MNWNWMTLELFGERTTFLSPHIVNPPVRLANFPHVGPPLNVSGITEIVAPFGVDLYEAVSELSRELTRELREC